MFLNEQVVKVKKIVEQTDKKAVVHLQSSRKKTDFEKNKEYKTNWLNGDYAYTDIGFVNFVGKASVFILEEVEEGTLIKLTKWQMTKEPYEDKGGKPVTPKNYQFTVFDAELVRPSSKNNTSDSPASEDFPF